MNGKWKSINKFHHNHNQIKDKWKINLNFYQFNKKNQMNYLKVWSFFGVLLKGWKMFFFERKKLLKKAFWSFFQKSISELFKKKAFFVEKAYFVFFLFFWSFWLILTCEKFQKERFWQKKAFAEIFQNELFKTWIIFNQSFHWISFNKKVFMIWSFWQDLTKIKKQKKN